ncbi:hypothetical protein, partial [Microbulbifer sediminum]|uniref:hypothetical protein n=1 Tax=Microbulbifer sediminum TaxID=2904250 RepID=UPI001F406A59
KKINHLELPPRHFSSSEGANYTDWQSPVQALFSIGAEKALSGWSPLYWRLTPPCHYRGATC